jgi:hypothetical protein
MKALIVASKEIVLEVNEEKIERVVRDLGFSERWL